MSASPTLRRRLLLGLLLPLLALLGIGVVADYRTGVRLAEDAYDHALTSTAIALAARLELDKDHDLDVDLPAAAEAVLRSDPTDRIDFAVYDHQGKLISGNAGLRELAAAEGSANPAFSDAVRDGTPLRVVTYRYAGPEGMATIIVVETTRKRQRAAAQVLVSTGWPNVLMVAATLLIVFFGVRYALAPLDALGRSIDRRAPDDLGPIPLHGTPGEARPLVAALNRLMDNLRRATALQQAFLSNAAHQLRTPLAGLQTQVELALDAVAAHDRPRLEAMRDATARLVRLTHQMLALARSAPEAGAGQPCEPVDLPALLEDAACGHLDRALARGIDLGFEPAPATVTGSRWLLHEMLANLIDNALAYAPAGSAVTVRCGTTADGGAFLEVEDAGPGIPAAERARVIERFYRVPGSEPAGSGLGLAIVHEGACRHGARLDLGDGAHGRGTRARVSFPAP